MLGHKTSFYNLKKNEIISSIFSDHNCRSLEINYKGKKLKENPTNTWKLNNMLQNNQWATKEIKEEIKSTWRLMKMKTQSKIYETQKKQF